MFDLEVKHINPPSLIIDVFNFGYKQISFFELKKEKKKV